MEHDDMFMGNRSQTGNKYNPNNATTNSFNFETTLTESHALNHPHQQQQRYSLYAGDGSSRIHQSADPHLVCLKLGKRHYFEGSTDLNNNRHSAGGFSIGKKGKPYYDNLSGEGGGPSSSTGPRCQVEGCNVTLVNAKDYHRRHKVCETHSKAPKVVVLGLEQRFCQQCSRFHLVSEFDDSKRSCRRRLAGHNERRRKTSQDSATRNFAHDNKPMTGSFPYVSSPTGRALSLLSSKVDSWISPSNLSTRSSAALRELIVENRAAVLARQLVLERDWHYIGEPQPAGSNPILVQHHSMLDPHRWDFPFPEIGGQVTLDLMQASNTAFGMLSVRGKTKEEEEECSELWHSLQGTHG
ncbi:hypothetical protein ERO13_A12G095900v2 [Gossypium hirsutum]|uniref:SQUAMOSA promoter binding-like transcription factor n=2 Tax=Gossypium TaxID=3633 RepID=A0A088DLF7_GOSHI|nr:squamosa promoter-binding-like protein 7 [Gossypium hirsutum]AIL95855.1 SQUAMOSA promoter binding-like transcription factor [Gossypium hirsutum]KAG4169673.1 hypothetical protein ERO13_A12G095900v2 [Gossypium hirsutum]TYH95521.1 hypothetical protein ES332_A12G111400v1 [Gossypium tomentosum]